MNDTDRRTASAGAALYFAYYAGAAALIPFLSLYLRGIGLPGRQIGVLVAIPPVAFLFGSGVWGMMADRAANPLWVYRVTLVLSLSAAVLIPLAGGVLAIALAVTAYALGQSGIVPVLDSLVLSGLGENRAAYGRIRLWGAVGWGTVAAAVGVVADAFGIAVVFNVYAVSLTLATGISFLFPRPSPPSTGEKRAGGIRTLLSIPAFRVLLVLCVAEGVVFGILANYLFIHLQLLGATGTLLGLMLTAATVSEVLFFVVTPSLLRRFPAQRLILFAVGVMLTRLVLYIPLSGPVPALAIQLLHGPGFALFVAAAVTLAAELAPSGTAASAQGAVTATTFGLGAALGAVGGGAVLERGGTVGVLAVAAAVVLVLALAAILLSLHAASARG